MQGVGFLECRAVPLWQLSRLLRLRHVADERRRCNLSVMRRSMLGFYNELMFLSCIFSTSCGSSFARKQSR